MMGDYDRKVLAHSVKQIAKDYGEIMTKHIIPCIHDGNGSRLRDAFKKGEDEFNGKYGIE